MVVIEKRGVILGISAVQPMKGTIKYCAKILCSLQTIKITSLFIFFLIYLQR